MAADLQYASPGRQVQRDQELALVGEGQVVWMVEVGEFPELPIVDASLQALVLVDTGGAQVPTSCEGGPSPTGRGEEIGPLGGEWIAIERVAIKALAHGY